MEQLAQGVVGGLHAQGLIHGDLKPGNILVRPDGRLVLMDMGSVCKMAPAGEQTAYAPLRTTRRWCVQGMGMRGLPLAWHCLREQ